MGVCLIYQVKVFFLVQGKVFSSLPAYMMVSFSRPQFHLSFCVSVVHLFVLPRIGFPPLPLSLKRIPTPQIKSHITQMEDDQNGRRPKWKMTKMEDDHKSCLSEHSFLDFNGYLH